MALYTGYFDDSGHEFDEVLLVGGLVLDVDRIREFDAAWLGAISPLAQLHMKNFVTGNKEYAAEWKNRYEEKIAIVGAAAKVIANFSFQTFSVALGMEDYLSVNSTIKISETGGHPFVICARLADEQLQQWRSRHCINERIKVVFEKRQEGMGETVDSFERDQLPIPSFEGKEVYALQAADLIAWMKLGQIRKSDNYRRFAECLQEIPKVLHTQDWVGYSTLMGMAREISRIAAQSIPMRSDSMPVVYHNTQRRNRVPFRRKK